MVSDTCGDGALAPEGPLGNVIAATAAGVAVATTVVGEVEDAA